VTLPVLFDPASADRPADDLLVLFPGAGMCAEDFRSHGFIAAVRRQAWPVDVLAVDTGVDFYLEAEVARRLSDSIRRPPGRLWLAGISLGGLGALLYAQAFPAEVAGLLLIAPFIGSRGLIVEVEQAGGFTGWDCGEASLPERDLLVWLKSYREGATGYPPIHLAYGTEDRFSAAHRLLGTLLPDERILTREGGHDWQTWERLWDDLLLSKPFAAAGAAA
jgi:pimeloyl-ACP methyl ester carboxylesterase